MGFGLKDMHDTITKAVLAARNCIPSIMTIMTLNFAISNACTERISWISSASISSDGSVCYKTYAFSVLCSKSSSLAERKPVAESCFCRLKSLRLHMPYQDENPEKLSIISSICLLKLKSLNIATQTDVLGLGKLKPVKLLRLALIWPIWLISSAALQNIFMLHKLQLLCPSSLWCHLLQQGIALDYLDGLKTCYEFIRMYTMISQIGQTALCSSCDSILQVLLFHGSRLWQSWRFMVFLAPASLLACNPRVSSTWNVLAAYIQLWSPISSATDQNTLNHCDRWSWPLKWTHLIFTAFAMHALARLIGYGRQVSFYLIQLSGKADFSKTNFKSRSALNAAVQPPSSARRYLLIDAWWSETFWSYHYGLAGRFCKESLSKDMLHPRY